ncbi:Non-specific serine/threonine protein kinase [Bertholletia excelsa]
MAAFASIFLITMLSVFIMSIRAASSSSGNSSTISPGSFIRAGTNSSAWLSPSGFYAFGFYPQGNGYAVGVFMAGIPNKTVVWTANRDGPNIGKDANASLIFAPESRTLVLRQTQGPDIPVLGNTVSAAFASMLDSGNFVLNNFDGQPIWQSFLNPTDTILPGQSLLVGSKLISSSSDANQSSGLFRVFMQEDGYVAWYPVNTPNEIPYGYWDSGDPGGQKIQSLNLDASGRIYLLTANGTTAKNISDTGGASPKTNNQAWQTSWFKPEDVCAPKGLCGLNAFCVEVNSQVDCQCLPGLDFINSSNRKSGCERKFVAQKCNDNMSERITYNLTEAKNIKWPGNNSYAQPPSITKEDCENSCLDDCNCQVALFKDGSCRKQILPLEYVSKDDNDRGVTLVKVPSTTQPPSDQVPANKNDQKFKALIISSASLGAFALLVLAISAVIIHKNHVLAHAIMVTQRLSDGGLSNDVGLKSFTYAQLEQVTDGFKEELGKGAFGTVYRGTIPYNQKIVAVKRLDKVSADGEREFHTEIQVIGRAHHRNLVRLIGYCIDGPNRLLVYEYMSNGSLADALFTSERKLSWDERVGIALDIAKGIHYLHEECETQIIHCDIKPQNILMDEYGNTRISDFGLAKLLKPDQTKTSTGIRGTRGYIAPEWYRKSPVTVKADIYSFGVVLLEIICYRKCVDWSLSKEEAILDEWVYNCFEAQELGRLINDEKVDRAMLERMVKIGLWCIQDSPSQRPSIKQVLLMLQGIVNIPVPPCPVSSLS